MYEVGDSAVRLAFSVSPADHDVRVSSWLGERCVHDFHSVSVQGLVLRSEKGRELVEVQASGTHTVYVFVRPEICVTAVCRASG